MATNLGAYPGGIAFDGARVWTGNIGDPIGSVSIITPGPTIPWTATTITTGFSYPIGALFDGTNIWVTDANLGKLFKLNGAGAILQTVTVGAVPEYPVFDGTNIWVPNGGSNSVTIVRASSGAVLQTLTGNGLDSPTQATFDGERVLVRDFNSGNVSLWKAADLAPLGTISLGVGSNPLGGCSDGANFWVALFNGNKLVKF